MLQTIYPILVLAALLVESAIGYPSRLFAAIGHPVTWIGAAIGWLDDGLNRTDVSPARRRFRGVLVALVLAGTAALAGHGIEKLSIGQLGDTAGWLLVAVLMSSLIAGRSLDDHVAAVATALESGGTEAGRKAVARIVGRDTAGLDEAGISRAAIESLAENYADGVVAPAFWGVVGGLGGAAAYKAVNTADSMIGHLNERHRDFGWASARLDDLVNLPASRLAALLLVLAGLFHRHADPAGAIRAIRRDARRHRSPNAGWPEAAMAGALGFRLAGARSYGGVITDDPAMG
ncbi:MAG: adenosylcobinamide-phosphate synthase CbiB, partial [Hyphomicrobiaceae bacterium]